MELERRAAFADAERARAAFGPAMQAAGYPGGVRRLVGERDWRRGDTVVCWHLWDYEEEGSGMAYSTYTVHVYLGEDGIMYRNSRIYKRRLFGGIKFIDAVRPKENTSAMWSPELAELVGQLAAQHGVTL